MVHGVDPEFLYDPLPPVGVRIESGSAIGWFILLLSAILLIIIVRAPSAGVPPYRCGRRRGQLTCAGPCRIRNPERTAILSLRKNQCLAAGAPSRP